MFKQAKLEEITFLLSHAVSPLPYSQIPAACELQPLKWILAIKQSPSKDASSPPVQRYRARLVSASHRSRFRHSVHGNAPTASLSTLRVLYGIVPTWLHQSYDDPLTVFTRDVTKAYLQSQPTKRLVFYRPPPEFEEYFPEQKDQAWKARVQLYGDVEAGLYWHKTFVPWLTDNIPDLHQSIYDPSLLYSPTRNMAIALCTDDTCNVLPQSVLPLEQKVIERFECRSRSQLPTDFKGLDISIQNGDVILSQNEYINLAIQEAPIIAKSEQTREMNAEELSGHRKVAGQLAWIATGPSPLSAFCASVSLQGSSKPLFLRKDTIDALRLADKEKLASITYKPLHPNSMHVRVYTDGAYQNLHEKHSQIGFLVALCDEKDTFNLVHWHSSKSPRRAHSTEESELMALDVNLKCIRNLRMIIFQLAKKEIPIVVYLDNQSLWSNLMNETVPSLPEVMYRCREHIHNGTIASVCLIPGDSNPADAMAKKKPNKSLRQALANNVCVTPTTRVFMLQTSPYRHAKYIPTSAVPMPNDDYG